MKNQGFRCGERGGAVVWILVLIALLGALTYAATRGNRGGMSNLDKEKTELSAVEILSFANGVREGVRSLKIKGCADTQISFQTNMLGGAYNNPTAPGDSSCHVFNSAGAGLSFMPALENWFDINQRGSTHSGQWFFTGNAYVAGIGTDGAGDSCANGTCMDLLIGLPYISENLCHSINKKLGFGDSVGTPPRDTGMSFAASSLGVFDGAYPASGAGMGAATPGSYSNQMAGCIEGDTNPPSGTYHFFQVLLAR